MAGVFIDAVQTAAPSRYNLLDTIGTKTAPKQAFFEGIQYDSEYCGVARAYSPACVFPDYGDLSISVDNARQATITSTGLPTTSTYRIVWGDGAETAAEAAQLNEAHTYAADGSYTVQVYGNTLGAYGEVAITVTNGATSGPFTDTSVSEMKLADDGITTVSGVPIPIYHLFQCRLPSGSKEGEARALRSLNLGASRALESGFQTVFATSATDVTPSGTAVDIVKGLSLLEEYAGENYGGRPVIHMTRAAATLLYARGSLVRVGDVLETGLGSLVVAGAGYDAQVSLPSAPAAGAGWMYATGMVSIWEGTTIVSGVQPKDPYTNEFQALAERVYVPTFECFKAAVEVTETAI